MHALGYNMHSAYPASHARCLCRYCMHSACALELHAQWLPLIGIMANDVNMGQCKDPYLSVINICGCTWAVKFITSLIDHGLLDHSQPCAQPMPGLGQHPETRSHSLPQQLRDIDQGAGARVSRWPHGSDHMIQNDCICQSIAAITMRAFKLSCVE